MFAQATDCEEISVSLMLNDVDGALSHRVYSAGLAKAIFSKGHALGHIINYTTAFLQRIKTPSSGADRCIIGGKDSQSPCFSEHIADTVTECQPLRHPFLPMGYDVGHG